MGMGLSAEGLTARQKNYLAHRFAWAEVHGEIPAGMFVCHKCDRPSCINVDHLFLGTHADNMADMRAKGRGNKAKGSANNKAKLHEVDIPMIREMLRTGWSLRSIAKLFGVGQATIWDIKKGKIWAHA